MNLRDTIPSRQNLHKIIVNVANLLTPPPNITISQWADSERYLSSEYNPEPGKWYTDSAPYQREMMDVVKQRDVHTVIVMASAQVGKTEIIKNVVGYMVDKEPCPILLVQPTLEIAEAWSKDRLKPMVRDTPALTGKIKLKSRDGENTILHKTFPGGHITMAGANSPASLASRPIRTLCLDEVDRYPHSAGEEGDPVNLAIKRTTRFWNKKVLMVSTPTIKGKSRIETAYLDSDRRIFEVPCPHCDHYHMLEFANIKRPYDNAPAEEWEYCCPECGTAIDENYKMPMLRAGKWRATAPFHGKVGFWINELYSPWVTWREMVKNFLEAKKLPETLKTFVNTSLAQTWDEHHAAENLDSGELFDRRENYRSQVPSGVYLLTAAVDVQSDRLEVEVLGWGMDRETWSIMYRPLYGDPATSDVWQQLDDILSAEYKHATGLSLKIACTLVDSGGDRTQDVYKYIQKKAGEKRRIYGVRGHSVRGKPILDKLSRNNPYKVKIFYCGTDTTKEMIYSYLSLIEEGPGYMHHPADYDAAYFKQLTAEYKKEVHEKGRRVTKWICPPGKRNEALDIKVYNFCAYEVLKPNMAMVKSRFDRDLEFFLEKKAQHKKAQASHTEKKPAKPVPSNKKRGGFVTNY